MRTRYGKRPSSPAGRCAAAPVLALLTVLGMIGGAPTARADTGSGGAITARYEALGGADGVLGAERSGETCGTSDGGCYRSYENGTIVWTAATGAHEIHGNFLTQWRQSGSEDGSLGYPVTGISCTLIQNGCFQRFQRGSIVRDGAAGAMWAAHILKGAIGARWNATGQARGYLGYPRSDESCGQDNGTIGCVQSFSFGLIEWTPATGAHSVHHEIERKWEDEGAEDGYLGLPVSEAEVGAGTMTMTQYFQGGAIHLTAADALLVVRGAVYEAWSAAGALEGDYGAPVGDARCDASGTCTQEFEHGTITR